MENLKIRVANKAESKEAQELFFELGYYWAFMNLGKNFYLNEKDIYLFAESNGILGTGIKENESFFNDYRGKEITIQEIKDMAILKRNDLKDRTHTDQYGWSWFISSDGKGYVFGVGNANGLHQWDESSLEYVDLKPIQKEKSVKEYLNRLEDGTYKLVVLDSVVDGHDGLIEVPEGSETFNYYGDENNSFFLKKLHGDVVYANEMNGWSWGSWGGYDFDGVICLWKRHTQPEEKSLNNQYAEIEQARQQEKHSHYKKDVSSLKSIDVYRVLDLFGVESHAVGHAIKKLLCSGQRGGKDRKQDIQEAIDSLNRELEMVEENEL